MTSLPMAHNFHFVGQLSSASQPYLSHFSPVITYSSQPAFIYITNVLHASNLWNIHTIFLSESAILFGAFHFCTDNVFILWCCRPRPPYWSPARWLFLHITGLHLLPQLRCVQNFGSTLRLQHAKQQIRWQSYRQRYCRAAEQDNGRYTANMILLILGLATESIYHTLLEQSLW